MHARAAIESLLRARKFDITLPGPLSAPPGEDLAPTGVPELDAALGGGLRRGHVSEIIGPRSSGRTRTICHALGRCIGRGELAALIDTCDRFDPESAAAAGLDLRRLLWVRDTGDAVRAVKAMNLVLQAGGFGLVVLDVADVVPRTVRALPLNTWFRLARVIEASPTVAVVVAAEHVARSSGGVTIDMSGTDVRRALAPVDREGSRAVWIGQSDRARLLKGLITEPRVAGARMLNPGV